MKATGMVVAVIVGMGIPVYAGGLGLRQNTSFHSAATQTFQYNGREIRTGGTEFTQFPAGFRFNGQNQRGDRNRRNRDRSGCSDAYSGAYYPDSYYYAGGYNNCSQGYIGPKRYDQPNAYTAGRFGYAGPNGYSAPDGYAGPYGYPFDNPVWWDWRFHHPYRPYR